jgi:RNA polymerase sigma-70 factor (ECF subfamily)
MLRTQALQASASPLDARPAECVDGVLMWRVMVRDCRPSLAELYRRYAALLLDVAARACGSSDFAEDLVHDLFERLHRDAHRYDPARGTVHAWLFRIVRNAGIDLRRRMAIGARVVEQLGRITIEPDPWDDRMRDSASTRAEQVRDAVAALPRALRTTLQIAYLEGRSYRDIAEKYGVPLGTVKSRAARAMHAVRLAAGD